MQKRRRKQTRPLSVSLDAMSQWQQEEVYVQHWQELTAMEPSNICRRGLVSYDREQETYIVTMLNQEYRIQPSLRSITREAATASGPFRYEDISFGEALVLVLYLLRARDLPLAGKQRTEKELPGGETFFRGPHELPRGPIVSRFGRDPEGFQRAAAVLGGQRLDFGDAAFRFQALPRVPLDYILWTEDNEFPARLTLAFDLTVSEHLPLDVIWALVHLTTRRLVDAGAAVS